MKFILVDGIHLACLTIEVGKCLSAMDETWKEAISQSFVFYENFSAMEKCARTRFFIPSGFRKASRQWKKVAELAFNEPSDSTEAESGWKLVAGRQ